jgi:hypothetical protein
MRKLKKLLNSILLLLVIFTIFGALTACTQEQNTPPKVPEPTEQEPTSPSEQSIDEDIGDYFPLSVGNRWEYEGEGNEYATYTQEVLYKDDNKYHVMVNNGGTVMANVYEVSKDKIVNTYREAENYDNKNVLDKPSNLSITILLLPIKVGNKWVSGENSYEIVDINTKLTVPAGSFDGCIAVKETYKDGNSYQMLYYKKGIGLIKSEFHSEEQYVVSSSLKSYKINN